MAWVTLEQGCKNKFRLAILRFFFLLWGTNGVILKTPFGCVPCFFLFSKGSVFSSYFFSSLLPTCSTLNLICRLPSKAWHHRYRLYLASSFVISNLILFSFLGISTFFNKAPFYLCWSSLSESIFQTKTWGRFQRKICWPRTFRYCSIFFHLVAVCPSLTLQTIRYCGEWCSMSQQKPARVARQNKTKQNNSDFGPEDGLKSENFHFHICVHICGIFGQNWFFGQTS